MKIMLLLLLLGMTKTLYFTLTTSIITFIMITITWTIIPTIKISMAAIITITTITTKTTPIRKTTQTKTIQKELNNYPKNHHP